jgi:hypothetical protein
VREGVNVPVKVGEGVNVSVVVGEDPAVRMGVNEEVGERVADMVGWMRMGVSVRIVGECEGVTIKGLGATVTVSMSRQAESKNDETAMAAINCFMVPPQIASDPSLYFRNNFPYEL